MEYFTLTWHERGIHPYDPYALSSDKLRFVIPYYWSIVGGYYQWRTCPMAEYDTLQAVIADIEAIERAYRDAGVYEISRYMDGEIPTLLIRATVWGIPGAWEAAVVARKVQLVGAKEIGESHPAKI